MFIEVGRTVIQSVILSKEKKTDKAPITDSVLLYDEDVHSDDGTSPLNSCC